MTFLVIVVALLVGAFLNVLRKEPRSLWSGITLTGVIFTIGFILVAIYILHAEWIDAHIQMFYPLFFVLCVIAVILVFSPLIYVVTYIIEGIRLIRREGLRFTNLLSILFAAGLTVYAMFMPYLVRISLQGPIRYLVLLADFAVMYLFFIYTIFFLSEFVNLHHIRKRKNLDYIVVLGCGVNGDQITPLLKGRVDRGLQVLQYNPRAKLILSGGQGPGEDISEAECMKRYALEQGVDSERIILEDQSANTEENLKFSVLKMDKDHPEIAIVTNSFHVFRSLVLAREMNISCIGYGSRKKMYFSLNARIREFVGYLKITRRKHLKVFACSAVFLLILFLLSL